MSEKNAETLIGSITEYSKKDLVSLWRCDERTVQNRVKQHGLSRRQEGKYAYYSVPEHIVEKYREESKNDPGIMPEKKVGLSSGNMDHLVQEIKEIYQEQIQELKRQQEEKDTLLRQQLSEKDSIIEDLRKDKDVLNNQLGNTSQALVRMKDLEKQWKEQHEKPWWRFWF